MTDTVRYSVGFGPAGEIAWKLFVKADVEKIFDYRAEVIGPLLAADIEKRSAGLQTA